MRVAVVVLGDVGRSPRTCYHALSLAEYGAQVTLVGYRGAALPPALSQHERLRVRYIPATPAIPPDYPRWAYVLYAPVKALLQLFILSYVLLLALPRQDCLLLQNPPAIPTLLVAQLPRLLRGTRLIIDWHNLGFSILALRLGNEHPLVRVHRWYERVLGRCADGHITVTAAMADWLARECYISKRKIVVLHDRPPESFHRLSVQEMHDFLVSMRAAYHDEYPQLFSNVATALGDTSRTLLTEVVSGTVRMRRDRPFVVVSSTSWTEDEDFGLLLDALAAVDKQGRRLLVVITGKGPLRDQYMRRADDMRLQNVSIVSVWLRPEEYPRLLGAADLGVSLHVSSSGLDLPMKVVDMFGCGLPVCAVDFSCLKELVRHNENGLVFTESSMLADQILRLSAAHPAQGEQLQQFRQTIASEFATRRWSDEWHDKAKRLFLGK
ncbi:mannosyltransferase [Sorochytrium milnesiophthora]